ncbi:MAG: glycoside hydrolase family 2 TIM barrel-domain containing protein [Lachnospiraceae bacterium]
MRKKLCIDKDWLYEEHDIKTNHSYLPIHEMDYDDSKWRVLNLPHDGSIEAEFKENNPSGPRGGYASYVMCYYRKHFDGAMFEKGQKVVVTFGGIYNNATVYFNGTELGTYPYGYTTVTYDLTPYFDFEGENILAVRVNNELQPSSRWYTGMGIYRSVYLEAVEDIHVDTQELIIKTPCCSSAVATVDITIPLVNNSVEKETIVVNAAILTADGTCVKEQAKTFFVCGNETRTIQMNEIVETPALWSATTPNRYIAKISITCNGNLVDEVEQYFGIRTVEFTPEGFFVNGTKERLKGVCLHHDNGSLGACAYKEAFVRKLQIMKDMGVNAIRTSHNPEDMGYLDLCDEMGFYVMEEAFDEWTWGKRPRVFGGLMIRIPIFSYAMHFKDYAQKDLEAMIKRDRNHPSIIAWSIGNEIEELRHEDGEKLTEWLTKIVHACDSTRPATIGCNGLAAINETNNPDIIDVCGYNYAENFYEEDHARKPLRCLIGSETSSATAFEPRGEYAQFLACGKTIDLTPAENADPEEQTIQGVNSSNTKARFYKAEKSWRSHLENDYVAGNFIWTGIDYLGETTPYIWPSISSYFAPVDRAYFPKDVFYFYKSIWSDKPVLYIFPHWNLEEHTGKEICVWCYTNCEEVELFVNGTSQGVQKLDGVDSFHLEWNEVIYQPGEVKAVGTYKGEKMEYLIKTAGEVAKLSLESDRQALELDKLAYLTVKATDADGVTVPDATEEVTITVSDNLSILGVDNGLPTDQTFKGNHITTWSGLARIIVQRTAPGEASVTVTSGTLVPATVEI